MTGQRFGRWTVLDDFQLSARGEKKWLCRCDCGTERYVLARSLRSGRSKSCGCLTRDRARLATEHSLAGKTFGQLTVLRLADDDGQNKSAGTHWLCRCSCGAQCVVAGTLLVTGRRTNCGDKNQHPKNYVTADITGRKIHRLTAICPTTRRDKKGYVIWRCRCDCGNEVDVPYNELLYGNMRSCGCRKREHSQALPGYLTRMDGTSLDIIRSKKLPADNTTGCKGVYLIRGQYVAKIVFQKKQYYLGQFDKYEDAVRARKQAEELLFDQTARFYTSWRAYADTDPEWAARNPVQITVSQNADKQLSVTFLPTFLVDETAAL